MLPRRGENSRWNGFADLSVAPVVVWRKEFFDPTEANPCEFCREPDRARDVERHVAIVGEEEVVWIAAALAHVRGECEVLFQPAGAFSVTGRQRQLAPDVAG